MVTYHQVSKILEEKNRVIDKDILDVLIWVKDKLQIDEKRKQFLDYYYNNLHETLDKLLKQETYTKNDIKNAFEDYTDYIDEIYTSNCYHCQQRMEGYSGKRDELYNKIYNFLHTHYYCYDSDYYEFPDTQRLRNLLLELYENLTK